MSETPPAIEMDDDGIDPSTVRLVRIGWVRFHEDVPLSLRDRLALRLIALIGKHSGIALLAAPDIRMHGNVDVWGPGGSAFRCGFYPPEEE